MPGKISLPLKLSLILINTMPEMLKTDMKKDKWNKKTKEKEKEKKRNTFKMLKI